MSFAVRKGFVAVGFLLGTMLITSLMLITYRLLTQKTESLLYALYAKAEQSATRSIIRIAQRQATLLSEKEKSLNLPIKELNGCIVCNASHCFAYRHSRLLLSCKRRYVFRKNDK